MDKSVDPPRVRQIAVPPPVRALSTLGHIDYADTFLLGVTDARAHTPEDWARTILEQAPATIRASLLAGWSTIGLKVGGPDAGRNVLGWPVRASTPEYVLLGADSRIGMPGQLVLTHRDNDALLFATFVQHRNCIARSMWATVRPTHVRVVRDLLEQASRRLHSARPTSGRTIDPGTAR